MRQALSRGVLELLEVRFPDVDLRFDDERQGGRNYYAPACFQVNVRDAQGEVMLLADGGFTDWTQKLLGNRRERLLISGFGTERFCA